jgi:hypothetical protein
VSPGTGKVYSGKVGDLVPNASNAAMLDERFMNDAGNGGINSTVPISTIRVIDPATSQVDPSASITALKAYQTRTSLTPPS